MAFDRTPSSTVLDPAILADLRVALNQSLESGSHGDKLKGLLVRAAADARQKNVQAEQLLLALKGVWYSLPGLAALPGNEVQARLLQELIARCVQEYYAS